jgi:glycosyltransferase involved in cell wall biosynthesis
MNKSKDNSANISWLTNLPAPYRIPLFEKLGQDFNLHVFFLLSEQNWREWEKPKANNYIFSFLSLRVWKFGEFEFIPQIKIKSSILKNADLIILGSWEAPMYLLTAIRAHLSRIPVIMFYESTPKSQQFHNPMVSKVRAYVYKLATKVISFGPSSTLALNKMGIHNSKVIELYNPVETKAEFTKRNYRSKIGHNYVYVGQLVDRKNVSSVLKAFNNVKKSGDTLQIAGKGILEVDLRVESELLGIASAVKFMGHLSSIDLDRLYSESDTLVLARKNEVWGLVVNEALSTGMHVVVSEQCGVIDLIKDMPGVFVCSTDVESIAKGMARSRESWNGPIENPRINDYSTKQFSEVLTQICKKLIVN